MEMRTWRGCSDMDPCIERQLETCADTRRGIDGELRARDARALLDDRGTDATRLQLASRQPSLEFEPLPVVFDDERAGVVGVGQPHEHVARATVLPHVDERLLDDPRELERGGRRQRDGMAVEDE